MIPKHIIELSINEANNGSCLKSKRGVAIWDKHEVAIASSNSPPIPFKCDDTCKNGCSKIAVHAEQRAIIDALQRGFILSECNMMHVKTINNELVISGGPSCVDCSKLIVETGIQNMWLYEEAGWIEYSAEDFHTETLKNIGIIK